MISVKVLSYLTKATSWEYCTNILIKATKEEKKSIAFKSLEAEICHPKWIEVGKATNCDNFFCHKILSEKFAWYFSSDQKPECN